MKVIAVLAILALGGCVPHPIYKTLQPNLEIVVKDDENKPVHRAQVNLISSSYPYGSEVGREIQATDSNGVVRWSRKIGQLFKVYSTD